MEILSLKQVSTNHAELKQSLELTIHGQLKEKPTALVQKGDTKQLTPICDDHEDIEIKNEEVQSQS